MKEGVIDPVRKFMSGPQKDIFENAREFVQTQEPNFAYLEGDEADLVKSSLLDPECFKGNRMQQVKVQVEALQGKIATQVDAERARGTKSVSELKTRLCGMPEFSALLADQQQQIVRSFDAFIDSITSQQLIAVIRDRLRHFEDSEYQRQLSQLTAWAQPKTNQISDDQKTQFLSVGKDQEQPNKVSEPRIEYVPSRSIKVSFQKAWLADEDDVEGYLQSMRAALIAEIRNGKRIQI